MNKSANELYTNLSSVFGGDWCVSPKLIAMALVSRWSNSGAAFPPVEESMRLVKRMAYLAFERRELGCVTLTQRELTDGLWKAFGLMDLVATPSLCEYITKVTDALYERPMVSTQEADTDEDFIEVKE